jgi:hypothetical protein
MGKQKKRGQTLACILPDANMMFVRCSSLFFATRMSHDMENEVFYAA